MPVVRSFGVCTVLVVCACATALPHPGTTTIRSVRIERLQVFDTPTGNILESAANSLHWTTTEATVRNELLFQEGDSLDAALIDETERNLRALPILTGAWIQVVSDSTDSVDVVIRTRDKWSLGGRVSYRQGGGLSALGMSLVEGNMFGKGQSVGLGYLYQEEDRASHGMSFELRRPPAVLEPLGSEPEACERTRPHDDLAGSRAAVLFGRCHLGGRRAVRRLARAAPLLRSDRPDCETRIGRRTGREPGQASRTARRSACTPALVTSAPAATPTRRSSRRSTTSIWAPSPSG